VSSDIRLAKIEYNRDSKNGVEKKNLYIHEYMLSFRIEIINDG